MDESIFSTSFKQVFRIFDRRVCRAFSGTYKTIKNRWNFQLLMLSTNVSEIDNRYNQEPDTSAPDIVDFRCQWIN